MLSACTSCTPVETLHLGGAEQLALPLLRQALKALPGVVDFLLLAQDQLGLGVRVLCQLGSRLVDVVHTLLVRCQVRLELLKLLLQHLHMLQVLAQLFGGDDGFLQETGRV